MVAKPARKSVAIVVPPNAQSLDVSGPLDAFLEANRQSSGGALYEVRLVATGASRTIKAGGMSLVADSSIFDDVRSIDTMLVAGTPDYAVGVSAHVTTIDLGIFGSIKFGTEHAATLGSLNAARDIFWNANVELGGRPDSELVIVAREGHLALLAKPDPISDGLVRLVKRATPSRLAALSQRWRDRLLRRD